MNWLDTVSAFAISEYWTGLSWLFSGRGWQILREVWTEIDQQICFISKTWAWIWFIVPLVRRTTMRLYFKIISVKWEAFVTHGEHVYVFLLSQFRTSAPFLCDNTKRRSPDPRPWLGCLNDGWTTRDKGNILRKQALTLKDKVTTRGRCFERKAYQLHCSSVMVNAQCNGPVLYKWEVKITCNTLYLTTL